MVASPELIQRLALVSPSRNALQGPESAISYGQMMQAVQALAEQLRQLGVKRAGLCGDNSPAWILADLACLQAGVVCVPVPVFFSKSQVSHLIEQAGLDCLLSVEQGTFSQHLGHGVWFQHLLVTGAGACMPDATAKITFTSGSTGTPKGVCLSGAQMTSTTLALRERLTDVELHWHLCILPLATLLENIAGVYLPLLMGASVTAVPLQNLGMTGSSGLDLDRLVAGINHSKPHSLILVPELAMVLVAAAEQGQLDCQSFRFVAVGGGRVSPELLERGRAIGLPLYEGYGLSECGSVVALNVPGDECEGTVGKPLSHVEVGLDKTHQIRVRGNTHLGYLGDAPERAGWLETGDLGAISPEGFLKVNGRAKNLLITSFGRNISPEWLESELIQALGAQQAFVFGDGDPNPSALVVIGGSRSPAQVRIALAALNSGLPDYARLATLYIRRKPLTLAEGYLTANGRPVRSRILIDLPTLLAEAIPVSQSPDLTHEPARRFSYGIF